MKELTAQFFPKIMAYRLRARHLEQSLRFTSLFDEDFSVAQILHKFNVAKEAGTLYFKAYRLAHMLELKELMPTTSQMADNLRSDLKRLASVIRVIRQKARQKGFMNLGAAVDTISKSFINDSAQLPMDLNEAADNWHTSTVRDELHNGLLRLMQTLPRLNRSELLRLKKHLDKIINY